MTERDTLGFKPYVEAVTDFLSDQDTKAPLTLSVEGGWGSGKSSFMKQMQRRLEKDKKRVLWFNAWRHEKADEMWAAFALAFVEQLAQRMSWHERPRAFLKLLRLRWGVSPGFWTLAVIGLPVLVVTLIVVLWFITWIAGVSVTAVAVAAIMIIRYAQMTVANPVLATLRKHMRGVNYVDRVAFIERFHKDFGRIVEAYTRGEKTFVFIDDLDRCEVPKAADLMQALNLLIDDDNHLVFVLGLDRERVAAGLAVKFEPLLPYVGTADEGAGSRRARIEFGYEFIEKFIQLPFQVPQADVGDKLDEFLDGLVPAKEAAHETKARGWHRKWLMRLYRLVPRRTTGRASSGLSKDLPEDLVIDAEQRAADEQRRRLQIYIGPDSDHIRAIVKMVAPALGGNPRRIKQFVNTFRLRVHIADRTGLLDLDGSAGSPAVSMEQLGKFVAIGLRWPLLLSDLSKDRGLLSTLSKSADSGVDPDDKRAACWLKDTALRDLLAYRPDPADESVDGIYSLVDVDVGRLLRAAPAVNPRPERLPTEEFEASDELTGAGTPAPETKEEAGEAQKETDDATATTSGVVSERDGLLLSVTASGQMTYQGDLESGQLTLEGIDGRKFDLRGIVGEQDSVFEASGSQLVCAASLTSFERSEDPTGMGSVAIFASSGGRDLVLRNALGVGLDGSLESLVVEDLTGREERPGFMGRGTITDIRIDDGHYFGVPASQVSARATITFFVHEIPGVNLETYLAHSGLGSQAIEVEEFTISLPTSPSMDAVS
ncbi:MAG: AAA family ATPase [Phycisphaerales bacterium]|nr:AAA family ATPase [Phycisphaerales bacterium]